MWVVIKGNFLLLHKTLVHLCHSKMLVKEFLWTCLCLFLSPSLIYKFFALELIFYRIIQLCRKLFIDCRRILNIHKFIKLLLCDHDHHHQCWASVLLYLHARWTIFCCCQNHWREVMQIRWSRRFFSSSSSRDNLTHARMQEKILLPRGVIYQ